MSSLATDLTVLSNFFLPFFLLHCPKKNVFGNCIYWLYVTILAVWSPSTGSFRLCLVDCGLMVHCGYVLTRQRTWQRGSCIQWPTLWSRYSSTTVKRLCAKETAAKTSFLLSRLDRVAHRFQIYPHSKPHISVFIYLM